MVKEKCKNGYDIKSIHSKISMYTFITKYSTLWNSYEFLSFLNFDNMKSKKIDMRNKIKKKSKSIRNCLICSSFGKV